MVVGHWEEGMATTGNHSGHLPDEELVARARTSCGSDAGHLEDLLDRHRPSIFRRCLSIVGDPDDAEDVTQEILMRIFRGLDGFQGRSSFRTWLHAIVQHECWTFAAKRGRQSMPEEVRTKIKLHFSSESQIHTTLISRQQLRSVLGMMPRHEREILQLRYLRDLPLAQIALLLGVSVSATKMRLYRALTSSQSLMDVPTTHSPYAHPEHRHSL
jgi:RNA polymerase sigma-70 factor (ECF subfamily)